GGLGSETPGGVAFAGCLISGGGAGSYYDCYCGFHPGSAGAEGLLVSGGVVALYDCSVHGGLGGDGCSQGGPGATACRLLASTATTGLMTSGSLLAGGYGGGGLGTSSHGGDGGDGLSSAAGTFVWLLDNTLQAGGGGQGCPWSNSCPQNDGHPGSPLSGAGQVFTFAPPKVGLTAPTPVREQTNVPITVTGAPGDQAYLRWSDATTFRPLPSWKGVLLVERVQPPLAAPVMMLGTIPTSGTL